jgi:hypothetical protein
MCSRPSSTLTAYLMRELIRGHQRESVPDEGAHQGQSERERA